MPRVFWGGRGTFDMKRKMSPYLPPSRFCTCIQKDRRTTLIRKPSPLCGAQPCCLHSRRTLCPPSAYQGILVAVMYHPAFLQGCTGLAGRVPDRLNHAHQRDVPRGAGEEKVRKTWLNEGVACHWTRADARGTAHSNRKLSNLAASAKGKRSVGQ